MKITICASIDFTPKIEEVAKTLTTQGYEVEIPMTSEDIIAGKLTLEEFKREKEENGDPILRKGIERKIKKDVIRRYYEKIKNSDAILVINVNKKDVPGYIGGNTFLEMGFAHVLNKPIYLYNPIPTMSYTDEITAMQPIILDGDPSRIKI